MSDTQNYLQSLVDILKQQGSTANEHVQGVIQAAQEALAKRPTPASGTVQQTPKP